MEDIKGLSAPWIDPKKAPKVKTQGEVGLLSSLTRTPEGVGLLAFPLNPCGRQKWQLGTP